jgi:hypothetical protein
MAHGGRFILPRRRSFTKSINGLAKPFGFLQTAQTLMAVGWPL